MNDKQKARWEEARHSIGTVICCLADDGRECDRCATDKGCPDTWSDVAEMVDKILNWFNQWLEERKASGDVKCPDCEWSQGFPPGENTGLTPCYQCNSRGFIMAPLRLEEK